MTKINDAGEEKDLNAGDGGADKGADKGADGAAEEKKPPIVETAEAKRARLKRQLKKVEAELGIAEEEADADAEKKSNNKPFKLGFAEKAFLNSNGIRGIDEYTLVTDMVQNTGKDIEEVIESKYFQAELKDLRIHKESKNASEAASGARKGQPPARDTVDYWVNRGELPPVHMQQLRRDVVNARAKLDKSPSNFTSTPVVGNH